MKIIFDSIIYSLQRSGGGSVYWTENVKRLPSDSENYIYDNANKNIFYDKTLFTNLHVLSSKFLVIKRYFNLHISNSYPFIFHSSLYRYCKSKNAVNITTVHDFTYEYYRKDIKSMLHKIQKKRAVMHSDGVICISENTKHDLNKFYPKYKGLIKVIYNGYDDSVYKFNKNIVKNDIILFVGSRINYKRFDKAVEIVARIPSLSFYIIGGGSLADSEIRILNENIPQRYKKLDYISNQELCNLYNSSFAFIYPSDYEGFGIPLLEAQACGCPVICQKKSSIPEVVGDACIYIDTNDLDSSVRAINKLFDKKYYSKMVASGLENVKKFSWDKSVNENHLFYQEVMDYETNHK